MFSVNPGPRTTLGTISIVGTPMMPQQDFLERLGIAAGVPFEPEALQRAHLELHRYAPYTHNCHRRTSPPALHLRGQRPGGQLDADCDARPSRQRDIQRRSAAQCNSCRPGAGRARGSADEDLQARATGSRISARADIAMRWPRTHARDADGQLLITFAVTRDQYRVSTVRNIRAVRRFPLPDLRSGLRTRVGEAYSDANLDADVTALESVYRGRGFAAAKVRPIPAPERRRPAPRRSPSRSASPHYGRGPHGGWRRPLRGERVRFGSSPPQCAQPPAGHAVNFDAQLQTRHRRD